MSYAPIRERLTAVLGIDPAALSRIGLQAAVRRRMRAIGVAEVDGYARRVDQDSGEFENLAMSVMVHETSFFRYPASFDLLVREARACLDADPASIFRVHCVASSTGEEPASIVMALLEVGVDLDRVRIGASDLSERAVSYAQAGLYRARSVRRLPPEVRERWFAPSGDGYELAADVRARVRTRRANALDADFGRREGPQDAVFCRNLMIYLVPEARQRLLRRLRSMLRPGGLLFVGHAEVAAARAAGLELASPPEAFACRCVRQGTFVPPRAVPSPSAPSRVQVSRPPLAAPTPPKPDVRAPLEHAQRLADAGDLEQAQRVLLDAMAEGPATAQHYHLLAVIEAARGHDEACEEALRRALYLDPHHAPSLLQLALVVESRGERARARRLRAKAARPDAKHEGGQS